LEAIKRLRACRVESPNGEIHFIPEETSVSQYSERFKDFSMAEIEKILRKEASKLLALFREE
jgi:hypothetical protein